MDSFKIFLILSSVAAANCYAITNDNQYQEGNTAAFHDAMFGEVLSNTRPVHYDEENLFTGDNLGNTYAIDYAHPALIDELYRSKRQTRNKISVTAEQQRNQGPNLNIEAQRNLLRSNNGRTSLDAQANYNRQFGPGGGRPNYGAGVTFTHRSANNGRSSLDATANVNRQFGGGRPNYGATLSYKYRF